MLSKSSLCYFHCIVIAILLPSVIEHAFQLGNASQKQSLLSELYSPELQLFRDLTLNNGGRCDGFLCNLLFLFTFMCSSYVLWLFKIARVTCLADIVFMGSR